MDIKIQGFAGTVEPWKSDFRVSANQFVGAPEDNHRTLYEVRAKEEDVQKLGYTVDDVIKAAKVLNTVLNAGTVRKIVDAAKEAIDKASEDAGIPANVSNYSAGIAIRVYDND